MKLAGWQLMVVTVALIALVGVLGWRGLLTGTELTLALTTIGAYFATSPLNKQGQGVISLRPPPSPEVK